MPRAATRTPGEAEPEGAANEAGDQPEDAGGPKSVTLTQAQLDEMLNRAVAQGVAMARAAPTRTADVELPSQAEVLAGIKAGKVKENTLSKDGWVVSDKYGEPADTSIKR